MNSVELATTVVRALIAQGVREAVLAPGSRNAPLAFALHAADQRGELRLHVRIDERDAGFLALGLAKASGNPVPVVTTSGTAVANLTPAVWEAAHSRIPVIALTADRPLHLLDAGANQATRQDGAFGRFIRADSRLESGVGDIAAVHHQVRRLVARATGAVGADPGPVHLNIGFDTPLVPENAPSWGAQAPENDGGPDSVRFQRGGEGAEPKPTPAEPKPGAGQQTGEALGPRPEVLPVGPRTVLLVGDASPEVGRRAFAAARAAHIPVLAEPTSNARLPGAIATYRMLLGTDLGAAIERVVVIGHPTLSRPVTTLLSRDDIELIVVQPHGDWADPGHRASRITAAVDFAPGDPTWQRRWRDADTRLTTAIAEHLVTQPRITGPELAAITVAQSRGNLVFGASQLIRDADLAPTADRAAATWANRGLGGIDGTIATAQGIGLATGEPTTVLLGDLTALHDAGGLLLGPDEPTTAVRLVIGNDRGGAIFHGLEQGAPQHAEVFERVFGTPHRVDLGLLAGAHGWQYRRVDDRAELARELATEPVGHQIVEVALDRSHRRDLNEELTALLRH